MTAKKSKPAAQAAVEPEVAAVEAEQPVEAIEAAVEEPEAEQAPEAEAEAPVEEAEPLPSHVLMKQVDGGSCDAYEADKDGNHRVPVEDVAELLSHGFEVVGTAD